MSDSPLSPVHNDLYAVEEIVVFRNVYLVRADSADDAVARYEDGASYLQQHLSSLPSQVNEVKFDADIVRLMRSTEQPEMTLEAFAAGRDRWLQNLVNERE